MKKTKKSHKWNCKYLTVAFFWTVLAPNKTHQKSHLVSTRWTVLAFNYKISQALLQ